MMSMAENRSPGDSRALVARIVSGGCLIFLACSCLWLLWHAIDEAVVGLVDVRVLPEQESSRLRFCSSDEGMKKKISMTREGGSYIGNLKGEGGVYCRVSLPAGEVDVSCGYLGMTCRRFDLSISGNTATCGLSWRASIP
jgi:hypothetical protein